MALDPASLETIKEWGLTVGAILGAAAAGWKGRARRESRVPHYTGPPDDQIRKFTRREYHDDVLNPINAHGLKLYEHGLKIAALERDTAATREVLDRHLMESSEALTAFTRLDERIASYIKHWDEASARAVRDRQEMMERIGRIDERLEDMERKRA